MQYIDKLAKGSGKGKIAAFISLTFPIMTFTKSGTKSPRNFALRSYKDYLENYVGYDKVYIISQYVEKKTVANEYFKKDDENGLIIFGINRKNLFNELNIDDIISTQHPLTFFGGILNDYYFSIANRLAEWYKVHGDGHYFTVQDDPEFATINPTLLLDKRIKEVSSLKYDRNTEEAKLYVEYRETGLLHQCLDNTIVAHCGTNYPLFFEARKNAKVKAPNVLTEAKYWCKFNAFTYQGVNNLLDKKLQNFSFDRKYVAEYHGYVKHDEVRINTTLDFYNGLEGKIKVIEGKAHFSDNFKNADKFKEIAYLNLFDDICSTCYSSLILANACTYNDFVSPRYFDIMLSDIIAFVYYEYDKDKKYTNDQELKEFMYVSSPEEFNEKVKRISTDEKYFRHIKYLQRKSIYDMFNEFMSNETIEKFKKFLKENKYLEDWKG